MFIELDILNPEAAEVKEVKVEKPQEAKLDRSRMTRLQIINIKGELVEVDVG